MLCNILRIVRPIIRNSLRHKMMETCMRTRGHPAVAAAAGDVVGKVCWACVAPCVVVQRRSA